jgi:hypothetical protein
VARQSTANFESAALRVPPRRLSPNLDHFADHPEHEPGNRDIADLLQNNSHSLQRNSNITAIEFQQFQ